jgi:hypothetical protein
MSSLRGRSQFISCRGQIMHNMGTTLTREGCGCSRGLTQFKSVTLASCHLSNDPVTISPPTIQLQTAKPAMQRIAVKRYAEAPTSHF